MSQNFLKWDSQFFGLNVVRLDVKSDNCVEHDLNDMQRQNVNLVYIVSKMKLSDDLIKQYNGRLLDEKITYSVSLEKYNSNENSNFNLIQTYSSEIPINQLELLAISSGKYSRFYKDPNISESQYIDLYKTWIKKSISKELADEVFVIDNHGEVIGFITVGSKDNRGNIGLLAVNAFHRKQNFGYSLVKRAQQWFVDKGFLEGQVVTQKDNIPACRLYNKCGYSIESLEYIYHFWI